MSPVCISKLIISSAAGREGGHAGSFPGMQTLRKLYQQPALAAPSANLPAGLLNPVFTEWVLCWQQIFDSDFLQHWMSVGQNSWCNCSILAGLNDKNAEVCLDSPGAALEIIYLLLSKVEAFWCSPMCITAFLFISFCVPQKQNWKCPVNGFVPRMKASHNSDRSLPRSWDWGFEKHTKDLRYDFFCLRGYPLLAQIYFCRSGRCCSAVTDMCTQPCKLQATLLVLTLWLTLPWSISNPIAALCLLPGCFLSPQLSQAGAAAETSDAVDACFLCRRGTCGLIPKQVLHYSPLPVTGWEGWDHLLHWMAGFVVQWIMKGSCTISRHTLLCGGGKDCALGEQWVHTWSEANWHQWLDP